MPTEGGRGQKSWKFADVLHGWSLRLIIMSNSHDFCQQEEIIFLLGESWTIWLVKQKKILYILIVV